VKKFRDADCLLRADITRKERCWHLRGPLTIWLSLPPRRSVRLLYRATPGAHLPAYHEHGPHTASVYRRFALVASCLALSLDGSRMRSPFTYAPKRSRGARTSTCVRNSNAGDGGLKTLSTAYRRPDFARASTAAGTLRVLPGAAHPVARPFPPSVLSGSWDVTGQLYAISVPANEMKRGARASSSFDHHRVHTYLRTTRTTYTLYHALPSMHSR